MEHAGFYWVGLIFWLLISSGFILLVLGLWKKSWKTLIVSGIALIVPTLYFGGAESWFRLFVFLPLIPLALALIIKRTNV
ncbi:hypothetical protein [Gottfriedia acidiceleris]|uniref:Uncharacterized protein n=1 Tax=Gottfriedia acidiceleris TaxID=371036 RepID=A0ABY4JQV0_9BACI|nr:hypothetical protein [Gottfriedia acidiceleris]UPM56221.1 hypothetical protein MY490_10465 [Gottfriedia acidiceleris]